MALRSRRRASGAEHAADEGPFVSFTDLFIGILFLFLILVAALMLMHQEAMRKQKEEALRMAEQIRQLQAQLATMVVPDPNAFRLGIVFNVYQRQSVANAPWTFVRTVQIFRAPNGRCINNVMLRSNLSTAWRPPAKEEEIPTAADQAYIRTSWPCGISGSGDHWETPLETGDLKRVSPTLYSGTSVLRRQGGDFKLEMQYRVLGVYDDYFRAR